MLLVFSFALVKTLFCYKPTRSLSILRKLSSSSLFELALAKKSFGFTPDRSLAMAIKSSSSLLFREYHVAVKLPPQC